MVMGSAGRCRLSAIAHTRSGSFARIPADAAIEPAGAREDVGVDSLRLLIEWANGWSVSRGRPTPSAVAGGVRIDASRPGRAARYMLPTLDRALLAGLGDAWTRVMAILGNWAVSNGTPTGLLAATGQGAILYHRLGWTAHGEIAGAVRAR
jgi:hypothetical protein